MTRFLVLALLALAGCVATPAPGDDDARRAAAMIVYSRILP